MLVVLAPRPLCLALAGDLRNGGEGYFHLVAEVVGKLVLLLNYLDERQKWLGRGDSEDEDDEIEKVLWNQLREVSRGLCVSV